MSPLEAEGNFAIREATTDLGHPVSVYRVTNPEHITPASRDAEESFLRQAGATNGVVHLAGPDPTYNCHGWVFACGRGWIQGNDVEAILSDNGYEQTKQPTAGDIIVYRDSNGAIVHTGFVRTVLPDGAVLVESKWCHFGRFIHLAGQYHDQHTVLSYYHTSRTGHQLNNADVE